MHLSTPTRAHTHMPALVHVFTLPTLVQLTGDLLRVHSFAGDSLLPMPTLVHLFTLTSPLQLTGDLLRVHSSAGDSLLPMPLPRSMLHSKPPISRQTLHFVMPPEVGGGGGEGGRGAGRRGVCGRKFGG